MIGDQGRLEKTARTLSRQELLPQSGSSSATIEKVACTRFYGQDALLLFAAKQANRFLAQ